MDFYRIFVGLTLSSVLFFQPSFAQSQKVGVETLLKNRDTYFDDQFNKSISFLFQNLSPADGLRGAIIAAPSRSNPDYYYHWVRDAALVTESLLDIYQKNTTNTGLRSQLKSFFIDHISFDQQIQKTANQFLGLGEPKFYVKGTPFTGPWGRPQNDGPGLRASGMIRLYSIASQNSWPELSQLAPVLYDAKLPTQSLIKQDLEHVGHRWTDASFDLWEEVNGSHFYTLMAQRKAMYLGAFVAAQLKDSGAAQFYQAQAGRINQALERFWNPGAGFIFATLDSRPSPAFTPMLRIRAKSQLDSAVLLAVLHSEIPNSSFTVQDPRVFSSYVKLRDAFKSIYSINSNS